MYLLDDFEERSKMCNYGNQTLSPKTLTSGEITIQSNFEQCLHHNIISYDENDNSDPLSFLDSTKNILFHLVKSYYQGDNSTPRVKRY